MPPEARLVTGLAVALAVVYAATPLAIRVADRFQFYDKPIGYKGHARPTPYLGGAAVMAGFLLALLAFSTDDRGRTLPLLGGMLVLWVVGTLDDRRNLTIWVRVLVEVLLAAMLWAFDMGWNLGAGGGVDLVLTILWVLAVVNAFNLFDNMDGAASTMALVVSAGVAIMGIVHDDTWLSIAAAVLCGACLGFLPHNLTSPARIFLGDGGSMPIGFGVAALVMVGAAEAVPASQALIVGLLLVGVPALDTGLVMISRRRRGVSILSGGRDHLTHRTRRWLPTARAVAIGLGAIQALVSAMALFAIGGGAEAVLLVVVLYLVAAATAIALLEATQREEAVVTVTTADGTAAPGTAPRRGPRLAPAAGLVALLGVFVAISPFFGGFYDEGKWLPIGLVLLTVTTAAAIARPPRLTLPALLCLGGAHGPGRAVAHLVGVGAVDRAGDHRGQPRVRSGGDPRHRARARAHRLSRRVAGGRAGRRDRRRRGLRARRPVRQCARPPLRRRPPEPAAGLHQRRGDRLHHGLLAVLLGGRAPRGMAGGRRGRDGDAHGVPGAADPVARRRAGDVGSIVVVVALVPGSRVRRTYALLACAAGMAAAGGPLTDVYDTGTTTGSVPADVGHRAALALVLVSLGVGIGWAVAVVALRRLAELRPDLPARLARAGVAVLAAGALLVAGVAVASAGRIENKVSTQWTAFTSNGTDLGSGSSQASATTNRLVSGSGARYDYWRVAVDAFADRPLLGVGAGNYDRPYYKERTTTEDVHQPHSIELQALSELGIGGAALLACFIAGLAIAAVRMRTAASASPLSATLMVAGVGVVTSWLVHTSVDWIHLMPGITGIALVMVAPLAMNRRPAEAVVRAPARSGRFALRPVAVAGAGLAGLALVLGASSLSRQGLADVFRNRADDALAARPADAIKEANRSLRLDAENPRTYYIKAAALARFNAADAARQTLLRGASKEPDNFVTWTLLGDLAVRMGHFGEAQRNYRRASALNPQDASLRQLARDPKSALQGTTP